MSKDNYKEMTPEREDHLGQVKMICAGRIDIKYRRGQAEHGGDLWRKPMLRSLADELTDANVYFATLERRVEDCMSLTKAIKHNVALGDYGFAGHQLDELYSMLSNL
jgi:hypothetical protein